MERLIIRKRQKPVQYYREDLGDGITMDMMLIRGGTFIMGSPETELRRSKREGPQHEVNISSFFLGKYHVTQAQWKAIAQQTDLQVSKELNPEPSQFKQDYEKKDDRWTRPVESISWDDAKEFCARLSQKTKRDYRLPTEAEWEYACRAGTRTPFHFGETITTDLANYNGASDQYGVYGRGLKGKSRGQTTPVGYFKVANEFGLYDMHGNVWEWCEDDWHENYNDAPNDGSPWLSKDSNYKILRGGSFDSYPFLCRSAYRSDDDARVIISHSLRFRVACVL